MKSGSEKWIVCRVCLKQPEEALQAIFDSNETEEEDITQMLHECGGVPIKRYDHFPDKICSRCLRCLRLAYKFRLTCQKSHKHLSRFIAPVVDEQIDTENVDSAGDIILETDEPDTLPFKEELNEGEDGIKQEYVDEELEEEEQEDDVVDVDEGQDNDILEMFEPLEFGEISEELCTPEVEMHTNEEVEFLEDYVSGTSDEDYVPTGKSSEKRNNPTKSATNQAAKYVKQKPTTSRKPSSSRPQSASQKKIMMLKNKRSKEKAYICDVCGNIYPSQGRLTEHIKLHKGIKPHDCEICGHAFAQTQQLARHMNTHTGNRPYKCSYCPAAFADLSTRNKHHRIHTNERPYVCDVCNKAFTYTNTLKFHKMIHTGEKPHVCDICGKGFQQAYKLRNHRYTHERKGIRMDKIKLESLDSYPEVSAAAAQLLEI